MNFNCKFDEKSAMWNTIKGGSTSQTIELNNEVNDELTPAYYSFTKVELASMLKAVQKQIPKKHNNCKCPNCGMDLDVWNYCPVCGQAIDWSKDE